jgi:hypothetical protein
MRKIWSFCFIYIAACGPETATTESDPTSTSEPDSSSGGTTTAPTTDTPTGSTSDPPTTASTGPDTDSSTGEQTTGSACLEFANDRVNDDVAVQFTCGLPLLCGGGEPVFFFAGDGVTTDDIETARCLAAALRDRTPGTIQYQQPSLGHHVTTIEILGEQAVHRDDFLQDFNWTYDEKVTFLRPTEFFTDCAEGSAFAVFNCLEDAFLDECAGELECPP